MDNQSTQLSPPPADLSPRVVQLARMIERLPPGSYDISIQKQDLRAQDWKVEIVRTEKIASVDLSRRPGE
jgi:hypothetical protein